MLDHQWKMVALQLIEGRWLIYKVKTIAREAEQEALARIIKELKEVKKGQKWSKNVQFPLDLTDLDLNDSGKPGAYFWQHLSSPRGVWTLEHPAYSYSQSVQRPKVKCLFIHKNIASTMI